MAKQLINYSTAEVNAAVGRAKDLEANAQVPSGAADLTSLKVAGTVYKVPQGGGGSGTVTSVGVMMNGETKGTVTTSGVIDLGTVLTQGATLPSAANAGDAAVWNGSAWVIQDGYGYTEQASNAENATVSIDWNGDTTGRDVLIDSMSVSSYKVGTNLPSALNLIGGTISYAGTVTGTATIKSPTEVTFTDAMACDFSEYALIANYTIKSGDASKLVVIQLFVLGGGIFRCNIATEPLTIVYCETDYPEDEYQIVIPSAGMFFSKYEEGENVTYVSNLTYSDGPATIVHKFDSKYIPSDTTKQDVLTAGSNVTISGNTISATDTKYEPATMFIDGLMSKDNYNKLSGIAALATKVSVSATGSSTTECLYITINGTEYKISGTGEVVQQVFMAEYGVTPYNTVITHYNNGELILCKRVDEDLVAHYYQLIRFADNVLVFNNIGISDAYYLEYCTLSSSGWSGNFNNPYILDSSQLYQTSVPTQENYSGLKFAVLSSEPATKYNGWLYFITE